MRITGGSRRRVKPLDKRIKKPPQLEKRRQEAVRLDKRIMTTPERTKLLEELYLKGRKGHRLTPAKIRRVR